MFEEIIPPYLFNQIYISFLQQNDCNTPKCGELSEYNDSAHTEVEDLSSRYMNESDVYDHSILPAPPVGGLPISLDWPDRTKLVRDRTIPIILPSGNNILANRMLKLIIGYTKQSRADLEAQSAFPLSLMPIWLGIQKKIMSLLAKLKKDYRITIPQILLTNRKNVID